MQNYLSNFEYPPRLPIIKLGVLAILFLIGLFGGELASSKR